MTAKQTATTHQSIGLLWLKDLGVTNADVNANGDVTFHGHTLTREEMNAGPFGTSKQTLTDFINRHKEQAQ